jgi:hypothetical protein
MDTGSTHSGRRVRRRDAVAARRHHG